MNHLVTGRWGIGPISLSRLSRSMYLMSTACSFQRMKDMALEALKRGDREGARFYGQQARSDWGCICRRLAS